MITTYGWKNYRRLEKELGVNRTLGQTGQGLVTFYQPDEKNSSWRVTLSKVLRNLVAKYWDQIAQTEYCSGST